MKCKSASDNILYLGLPIEILSVHDTYLTDQIKILNKVISNLDEFCGIHIKIALALRPLQSKLLEFIKNNDTQLPANDQKSIESHWRVSIPRPADYKINEMRDEFVRWLKNRELSKSYVSDIIKTYDKELVQFDLGNPDQIEAYVRKSKSRTMIIHSMRAVCNFLEYKGVQKQELIRLRQFLKLPKTNPDSFVPSDEVVQNALSKISESRFRLMFLTIAYSGIRITELVKMVREFDKDKLIVNENIAKYQLFYTRGHKKSYYVYLPKEFALSLHKFYIHGDTITHQISKTGLAPKYLRKWFYNFLIYNNVPEGVADFIEGRSAVSVGSMHYLSKAKQADYWYELVVEKLKMALD